MAEKTISFEVLALSSFLLTKNLISFLQHSKIVSPEDLDHIFEATKRDMHRTTVSVGPNELDEILTLFWRNYVPVSVNPETN